MSCSSPSFSDGGYPCIRSVKSGYVLIFCSLCVIPGSQHVICSNFIAVIFVSKIHTITVDDVMEVEFFHSLYFCRSLVCMAHDVECLQRRQRHIGFLTLGLLRIAGGLCSVLCSIASSRRNDSAEPQRFCSISFIRMRQWLSRFVTVVFFSDMNQMWI